MTATFLAAVALTVLVSLSITRPLRSLTRQAKEMAERRLPDAVTAILDIPLGDDVIVPKVTPVAVNTRDEVSDVADALNTVQDSALDLAVEQAVLRRNIADSFVNLGRRNQNLLGRQLDFITELESNETDADALAACSASTPRHPHAPQRESMLVLAGIEPPRQWRRRCSQGCRTGRARRGGELRPRARPRHRAGHRRRLCRRRPAHLLAELIETGSCSRRGPAGRDPGRSCAGPVDGYRSPSSTAASACPGESRRPTGAWPGPSRSPSPVQVLATTSPATALPATASTCACRTPERRRHRRRAVPPALLVDDAGVATATVPRRPTPDAGDAPGGLSVHRPSGPAAPTAPAGRPVAAPRVRSGPHTAPRRDVRHGQRLARRTPRGNGGARRAPPAARLRCPTRSWHPHAAAGQDPPDGLGAGGDPPASQAVRPRPWWPAPIPSPPGGRRTAAPGRGGATTGGGSADRLTGAKMPKTAPVSLRRHRSPTRPRASLPRGPRPTRHPSPADPPRTRRPHAEAPRSPPRGVRLPVELHGRGPARFEARAAARTMRPATDPRGTAAPPETALLECD